MLGGVKITDTTRKHAAEMLQMLNAAVTVNSKTLGKAALKGRPAFNCATSGVLRLVRDSSS